MVYSIYVLKCPFSFEIVYVGQTKKPLEERKKGHMVDLYNSKDLTKTEWILNLKKQKLSPLVELIETIETDSLKDALKRERHWIDYYKDQGCKLLNGQNYRPLKYGEETELVPIRMPKSKKAEVKALVENYLKQFIV